MSSVLARAAQVARLEIAALRYPPRLRAASVRSLPNRFAATVLGRGETTWMGSPMAVESRFESLLMHEHQRMVLDFLPRLDLPAGARVLDVGANVGQFAAALLAVRPDLELVSLEPNPFPRELLERNAARHASSWSVVPAGLSGSPGEAELWYVPGRSGQGSMVRAHAHRGMLGSPEGAVVPVRVELITAAMLLERLPEGRREFALVKVDVEAYERQVVGELAALSWRYLLLEVGTVEGVTTAEALELLRAGGVEARVVLERAGPGASDVLFERV